MREIGKEPKMPPNFDCLAISKCAFFNWQVVILHFSTQRMHIQD